MDTDRIKHELRQLRQRYRVNLNDKTWQARIDGLSFPDGWNPRQGAMLVDFPSNYAEAHPDVYMPERYTYEGNEWKQYSLQIGGSDIDDWEKVCLLNLSDHWVPDTYTTITLIRNIQQSMMQPDDPNWIAKQL